MLDIMNLNEELKDSLFHIVLIEQESLADIDKSNEDILLNSVTPIIKNKLKEFLFRKELINMNLGILKGTININSIDYKSLIREVIS
jgi:hypothetical protein